MNRKHRWMSSALALSLLSTGVSSVTTLAMNIHAEETETTYTVTLNNAQNGVTYKAYRIFKGTTAEIDGKTYLGDLEFDANGVNVDSLKGALSVDTAAAAAQKATENTLDFRTKALAAVKTATATTDVVSEGKATLTLPAGYYILTETDAENVTRAFVLEVINENEQVNLKTVIEPTVEKKVHENGLDQSTMNKLEYGDKAYQDVADYKIGETVPFVLKVGDVPKEADYKDWKSYKLTLTDTMSTGLTLDANSIHVYANNGEITEETYVTVNTSPQDATFTVSVDVMGAKGEQEVNPLDGKTIYVTFAATLNTDAIVGKPESDAAASANFNKVKLSFSNNPNTDEMKETPEDFTYVYTYALNIHKYDGSLAQTTYLPDAEFKVYKMEGDTEYYYKNENGVPTFVAGADNGDTLKTTADADLTIKGLDEGTYYIVETKAPNGFNKLTDPIKVNIDSKKDVDTPATDTNPKTLFNTLAVKEGENVDSKTMDTALVNIANNRGATLPSTGGMGTTMFYTVGGLLVAGAGLYLVTSRRMKRDGE